MSAIDAAYQVNDILSRFLATQRRVIQPWWRSLPLPGLFKPVDFPRHRTVFERLATELQTIQEKLATGSDSSSEGQLASVLLTYSAALRTAVVAAANICAKLAEKAEGKASYPPSDYRRDIQQFTELENEYLRRGQQLNQFFGR